MLQRIVHLTSPTPQQFTIPSSHFLPPCSTTKLPHIPTLSSYYLIPSLTTLPFSYPTTSLPHLTNTSTYLYPTSPLPHHLSPVTSLPRLFTTPATSLPQHLTTTPPHHYPTTSARSHHHPMISLLKAPKLT
ncbi:hypothetical protein Pcinc_023565 [Petrolisthes cinctipes]|uniref:Uncharacterized protein n=1 Tax=Petrolisthes cinctipes TaxID=88211 RepID=A0AAE1KFM2_PETCI|nr:hypothetical protein Pcinc_023565 [Petrolisthes cinctipes]